MWKLLMPNAVRFGVVLVLTACQTSAPVDRAQLASFQLAAATYGEERRDWGVPAQDTLRLRDYHAPTPMVVPGATTIDTAELKALIASEPRVVLVDALGGEPHDSIPFAVWLKDSGLGRSFEDPLQERLGAQLKELTQGDPERPVVFFCLSSDCWLSYNTSLRAAHLGYRHAFWYRGGVRAWKTANLPMTRVTSAW